MAKLKKYVQSRNLASHAVWVTDTDPNSRYFRLAQIPDVLTAGKNAFLINGSEELVATTEILIEITDSKGNTVFLQPIKNFVEGLARVISIEVYEDTPPGPATFTILGHLKQDAAGNTPPEEFVNAYNVKWQAQINISPERLNHTPIRLYRRPLLNVSEMLVPFRSSSVSSPVTINTGTVQFSYYQDTSFKATYVTSLTPTLSFTRDMVGGVISATVAGSPFSASITQVVNSHIAVLDNQLSSSITPVAYSFTYTPPPTFGLTVENRSFVDVRLNRLETFSGQIARGRIYVRSLDQNGDYQIVSDIQLQPTDLTVTSSISTGRQIVRMGDLDSQSTVNSYWNAGIIQDQNSYLVTGSVTPIYSSSVLLDSIHINTGSLVLPLGPPNYFFGLIAPLSFSGGNEYTLAATMTYTHVNTNPVRLDAYLVGTAFPTSSTDRLGIQIGSWAFDGSSKTVAPFTISKNLIPPTSGTAYLRFVVYNGEWHVANISVTSATERGFNPDEVRVLVPLSGRRLETLQFKAELFDPSSNVLPVTIEATPVFFSGSTFTTRGNDNSVTGTVTIGTLGTGGISLTTAGYTASDGTPVPNQPAIFIGGGRYSHPATPFFVGSGSTGTLFSLGNQLTWNGAVLAITGDVTLASGSVAFQAIVSASASAAQALASASYLDLRVFTDSTGLIVRPPTASAAGLYLGKTNLGYFSGSMWKTFMSDTGKFFLTGSDGSTNFLAWDGSSLLIAGNITILGGQGRIDIDNASSSAGKALISASNAQVTASLSLSSASLVDAKVFTDSTGKLVKPAITGSSGLYLGSTFLGFYSASQWRTFMSDTGNFFLTGSSSNFLSWNGATLTVAGNITILGGQAQTDILNAAASGTNAQTTANAASSSVTAVSASAALANASASLLDSKIFTDSTGKLVKPPVTSSAGLFIGSTFLGYFSGSSFKTFMSNTGNFFLTGSASNFLTWNGTTLAIAGNITILGGQAQSDILNAALSGTNAQTTANAVTTDVNSNVKPTLFTDSSGKINRPPTASGAGLYLGSTNLGYYNGSTWKTYMDNNGHFFLSGTGSDTLSWDGTTLSITGAVVISAGSTLTAITTAQSTANTGVANAATAQSTANVAVSRIMTDTLGKITSGSATGATGLYLTPAFMGYWNSSTGWQSYINSSGQFAFTGNTNNFISWDGSQFTVASTRLAISTTTLAINNTGSLAYISVGGTTSTSFTWADGGGAVTSVPDGVWADSTGKFKALINAKGIYVSGSGVTLFGTVTFNNSAIIPFVIPNTTINAGTITTGTVTATSFFTTSTRAAKNNIAPLVVNAIDIIKNVKLVTFEYKLYPSQSRVGFVAEDTHEILTGKDHDKFDTTNTIAILMKAVQELSVEVDRLKRR